MHYGTAIRERRKQLGLTDTAVADASGLTIHQYDDIEQHPDELISNVALGKAKRVCSTVGLELRRLLELPATRSRKETVSALIRKSRQAQNLTVSEVAKHIGFADEVIHSLEQRDEFAETLPVSVLFELEKALGLERGSLIV